MGYHRKTHAVLLCKSIVISIQWFQMPHIITFSTMYNLAVLFSGARVSQNLSLVPQLLPLFLAYEFDFRVHTVSNQTPGKRSKCRRSFNSGKFGRKGFFAYLYLFLSYYTGPRNVLSYCTGPRKHVPGWTTFASWSPLKRNSCIDIHARSCLKPFSIGRKPCSNSKTHVQIMKFTCRLNMGFGRRHWSMRRDVMFFVETKWPTLKKLRGFRRVFTLLVLFLRVD